MSVFIRGAIQYLREGVVAMDTFPAFWYHIYMDLSELKNLISEFKADAKKLSSAADFEQLRQQYAGKRGKIAQLFEAFAKLGAEEKKDFGKKINELKNEIELEIVDLQEKFLNKKAE